MKRRSDTSEQRFERELATSKNVDPTPPGRQPLPRLSPRRDPSAGAIYPLEPRFLLDAAGAATVAEAAAQSVADAQADAATTSDQPVATPYARGQSRRGARVPAGARGAPR